MSSRRMLKPPIQTSANCALKLLRARFNWTGTSGASTQRNAFLAAFATWPSRHEGHWRITRWFTQNLNPLPVWFAAPVSRPKRLWSPTQLFILLHVHSHVTNVTKTTSQLQRSGTTKFLPTLISVPTSARFVPNLSSLGNNWTSTKPLI